MTEIERIKKAMKFAGVKAPTLAEKIGYSTKGSVYAVLKGDNAVTERFLQGFCNAYPQISYAWLKSGQGSMELDTAGMVSQKHLLGNDSEPSFEELILTKISILSDHVIEIKNSLAQLKASINNGKTERINNKRARISNSRK